MKANLPTFIFLLMSILIANGSETEGQSHDLIQTIIHPEPHGSVVYPRHGTTAALSLNGNWSFHFVPDSSAACPSGFLSGETEQWPEIMVPSHWDLEGYTEPKYFRPDSASGFYVRTFSVPEEWSNRPVYLRFEGALYGLQVWVNQQFLGEWGSAFNPVTWNIRPFLNLDEPNVLSVRVTSKSFASAFDHHDDWGLAGLYREVWLFTLPENHLLDWKAETECLGVDSFRTSIHVKTHENSPVSGSLKASIARNENTITELDFESDGVNSYHASFEHDGLILWNAEVPTMLDLEFLWLDRNLKTLDSFKSPLVLRSLEVNGNRIVLNGKPIRLRGVNHHDLWPDTGRVASLDQIKMDLKLIKQMNANYLRTSHYPPDWRLIQMCAEQGIYVMDEVPFGFGDDLLEDVAYSGELLARAEATVRRDAHWGNILIWSIGNENPMTPYTLDALKRVKALLPGALTCFPMVGYYAESHYQEIPDYVDIYAPHYPAIPFLQSLPEVMESKPVVLTEFAHQLAKGGDGLQREWEFILQHEGMAGGSIWLFQDQGILRRYSGINEKPAGRVWLDSRHYYDTFGNLGADGLTFSDRTPKTNYYQAKAVFEPLRVVGEAINPTEPSITLTIQNGLTFRNTEGMRGFLKYYCDGVLVSTIGFEPEIEAHEISSVTIPFSDGVPNKSEVASWIDITVEDVDGTIVMTHVVELSKDPVLSPSEMGSGSGSMDVETMTATMDWVKTVFSENDTPLLFRVNRRPGLISDYWREVRDNQILDWSPSLLKPVFIGKTQRNHLPDGTEVFSRNVRFEPDYPAEVRLEGFLKVSVLPSGFIEIEYELETGSAEGFWLEAGLAWSMPDQLDHSYWMGSGPYASYPGKDKLSKFGVHNISRNDLYFDGNRSDVSFAGFSGASSKFDMLISAEDFSRSLNLSWENRENDQWVAGVNRYVSSVGGKFKLPEISVNVNEIERIQDRFYIRFARRGQWPHPWNILESHETNPKVFHPRFFQDEQ